MAKRRAHCRSRTPCSPALPGGLGKKLCPEDVDQKELRAGIKEEMEHTRSKARACAIALDHLQEHKSYYKRLRKARL